MIGKDLLNIILSEGVEVKEKHEDLIKELDKALDEDRVYFIPKGNIIIGFLTWEIKPKGLLINKCVIYKDFRRRFSMIGLHRYIRQLCQKVGCDNIYWKSKRRNKLCFVK
jgi:hypothetical protein